MSDLLRILSAAYPLLILLVLLILLSLYRKRQPRQLARRILAQQKAIWTTRHEYRHVSPDEFRDLDLAFYDRIQAFFESRGFRHLADLQNLTLAAIFPWSHAFTRVLLHPDGTTWVSVHDVKVRGWLALARRLNRMPMDLRTVALATAFSDNTYVVTANSLGTDNTSSPAAIRKYQYPQTTAPEELLEHHLWARAQVLQHDSNLYALPHADLDELIATWHQMQALGNAHYASMGYMNEEELKRIAGRLNQQVLREVVREIERLKAEEQQRLQASQG